MQAGDRKGALADFESAVKANPEKSRALFNAGQLHSPLHQETARRL